MLTIKAPLGDKYSPVEQGLAERVDQLALDHIEPWAAEADLSDTVHPQIHGAIRDAHLLEHYVPIEFGGVGTSVYQVCIIRERLAYSSVAADEAFISQGIPLQPIALFGNDEQRARFLPGALDGSRRYALCLTEPEAGSDILGLQMTARRDGDTFVLNGTKRYVFDFENANTLVVFAKTDDSVKRGGLSAFLFDRPTKGLTSTPFPLLATGPEGELQFTDCVVPAESLIGNEGEGARVALGNLDRLRPTVGAAAVGIARRALDETVDYLKQRNAFQKPLADFQGLRFKVAQAATELEAAKSLVYAAARFADSSTDRRAVAAASAKAKLFATEAANRIVDTAVQCHGGIGLKRGSITERLYRAVRPMRIYEGSSEIMKIVIARSELGPEGGK